MTIILTNDDGIDAPGIKALLRAVNSENVIVAAPKDHQSGCGHQVTTTRSINIQQRSEKEYAIAGTPADCVRIAISQICQDAKFVLSGINAGGNLGVDVYISGTVAAVREAAMNGIPGIAISHYRKAKQNFDWELAAKLTAEILADLIQHPLEAGCFWNVNLPHVQPGEPYPKVVFCQPCTKALPINYRVNGNDFYYVGEYGKRDRTPGSDVDVCFSGNIAITQLRV
ncbi:stationary-phase survival protein SurE [Nostoc sp. HK-01]|uniref:5'-nucleotidase n=2 Tax=Nostocales TaxID=1161 RepID=A0A1Z4GCR2_9CYAN|nr:5'/3'-nucleotidase SurE [Nostoc cycadae]BAY15267.1 stationary-phase survival protein SurE [Anabaenopsis circularis NIES-21]BBD60622.1 stationary-phase survival protein SurE [Nostoc sp. HK-01]GBE94513.1 3'-nucleotidase [Nostoc cycadae WK-1]